MNMITSVVAYAQGLASDAVEAIRDVALPDILNIAVLCLIVSNPEIWLILSLADALAKRTPASQNGPVVVDFRRASGV